MKIVIIDYGAGNIKSIQFAIERLGHTALLSSNEAEIRSADKVLFPGVGAAGSAMKKIVEQDLDIVIPALTQPVLGICLGMQLLCKSSEEGQTTGFGIFDTGVKRFQHSLKVPQVGWNTVAQLKGPLFKTIAENEYMYTVHSYYAPICDETVAISEYGHTYSAALQKDNFYGTQFHPEKSGSAGEQIIANFLKL